MTRSTAILLFSLAIAWPCHVVAQVAEGDARVTLLDDSLNQDYSINVAGGQTVFVLLAPGELIDTVELSSPSMYQLSVTPARDGLYIRQRNSGAEGVMTINAGGRRFVMALTSDISRPTPYIVSFRPSNRPAHPAASQPLAIVNNDYKLCGDKNLRPSSVSDDGTKTYIRWAPDQSIPAVFALDGVGRDETVNGYMRDGVFTIDKVYPRLIFRIDRREACAKRLLLKRPL